MPGRPRKDKSWTYWLGVIEIAGTNEPVGSAYNRAFGKILEREKLQSEVIDSATRNHSLQIAANRAAVEAWRETLPKNLRSKLNHPGSVYKRWKQANVVEKKEAKAPKASVKDSVVRLEEELAQAKAHIADRNSTRGGLGQGAAQLKRPVHRH